MFKSVLFLFYFFLIVGGQVSASLAANQSGILNLYTMILYFFFISRGIIWLFILREIPLSHAYTLTSLNYIIIPLVATFLLKENYSWKYAGGSALIITGIMLYTSGSKMSVSE